jgi:hypothetical protein
MRPFAWALVVVGLLIAVTGPVWLTVQASEWLEVAEENETFVGSSPISAARYRLALRRAAEAQSWRFTAVASGLAVGAFGVLLLAIRRPDRKPLADEHQGQGSR